MNITQGHFYLSGKYRGHDGYFGQPSGGFFLASDFLIASCQSISIFKTSGFGPRFSLIRFGLVRFLN